jgi:hypothetical protein
MVVSPREESNVFRHSSEPSPPLDEISSLEIPDEVRPGPSDDLVRLAAATSDVAPPASVHHNVAAVAEGSIPVASSAEQIIAGSTKQTVFVITAVDSIVVPPTRDRGCHADREEADEEDLAVVELMRSTLVKASSGRAASDPFRPRPWWWPR